MGPVEARLKLREVESLAPAGAAGEWGGASTQSQVSPWPLGLAAPQEAQPHPNASCKDVVKGVGGRAEGTRVAKTFLAAPGCPV